MSAELLTTRQVCDELHVSPVTLWRWRREGRFPPGRRVGKHVVWFREEVDEWLAAQPETPVTDGR